MFFSFLCACTSLPVCVRMWVGKLSHPPASAVTFQEGRLLMSLEQTLWSWFSLCSRVLGFAFCCTLFSFPKWRLDVDGHYCTLVRLCCTPRLKWTSLALQVCEECGCLVLLPPPIFPPHFFILGLVFSGTSLEKTSFWDPVFPMLPFSYALMRVLVHSRCFTGAQGPLALVVLASKFAHAQFELYGAALHFMKWNGQQRSRKLGW